MQDNIYSCLLLFGHEMEQNILMNVNDRATETANFKCRENGHSQIFPDFVFVSIHFSNVVRCDVMWALSYEILS